MARQSKATVDYFPHKVNHSQSLKIIIKRYQQTGYMFWYKLLELLGSSEFHFFDIQEEEKFEDFYTDCFIDFDLSMELLNKFAKLGMINQSLFEQGIIYSENFVENIKDAYRKRNINPVFFNEIVDTLTSKGRVTGITSAVLEVNSAINPQSKVKESIVDKSKEKESGFPPPSLSEIKSYCKEQKLTIKAESFYNYYTANGWMLGKVEMKDWKSALELWQSREPKPQKTKAQLEMDEQEHLKQAYDAIETREQAFSFIIARYLRTKGTSIKETFFEREWVIELFRKYDIIKKYVYDRVKEMTDE